jgi:hypothetical protein
LTIVSVGLLIGVIVLGVQVNKQGDEIAKIENTCTTKACIKAANLILSNIDQSADPCEDFNKFR